MKRLNLQFFAKVIDLTDKLSSEKSAIKIGEKEYEINDGFSTILEVDKLFKRTDISQTEQIEKFFEVIFGKACAKELLSKNYKISAYKEILSACLDLIKGDDDSGN